MTTGTPSVYKRMYEVRLREAALKENVGTVREQLQLDRLAFYVRDGLITADEAWVALVERLIHSVAGGNQEVWRFFPAYITEWRRTASFKELLDLACKWTRGSNVGTPMEEIGDLVEKQKPRAWEGSNNIPKG